MRSSRHLQEFAHKHGFESLSEHSLNLIEDRKYDFDKALPFISFQNRINAELLNHKVITSNPYTRWFSEARLNDAQVKHFIIQFSVFSNQFLVAQLQKMVNANTLEEMRASKEILANEIGVIFNDATSQSRPQGSSGNVGEMELGGLKGSVEGGTFHFKAAHFELLARTAEKLGLDFKLLGKRERGRSGTIYFCDELIRLYGHPDYAVAKAASYAVENWAAAGFWDELIAGLTHYKKEQSLKEFPLAFFTWHSKLEQNHARHTQEELEDYYFSFDIDEDQFIEKGNEMLDGVYAFWEGLDEDRRVLH